MSFDSGTKQVFEVYFTDTKGQKAKVDYVNTPPDVGDVVFAQDIITGKLKYTVVGSLDEVNQVE